MKRVGRTNLKPKEVIRRAKVTVTSRDILKILEKTKTIRDRKVKWVLDDYHAIRTTIYRREFCPVTFYGYIKTGKFVKITDVHLIAKRCGIPSRVCDEVTNAADQINFPALRKKLLKATGLLEQARKNGEKI